MNLIQKAFEPLATLPCWNVRRGHGSFVTFQFGEPTLIVREPVVAKPDVGIKLRRHFARGLAYPKGQWRLWIYCCQWRVREGDREVGEWSSNAKIDRAARFLNGQKLTSVTLNKRGARTTFSFDLGGHMETQPYDRKSEQWMLFEPGGKVLVWRADRHYSYVAGDHEVVWQRAR